MLPDAEYNFQTARSINIVSIDVKSMCWSLSPVPLPLTVCSVLQATQPNRPKYLQCPTARCQPEEPAQQHSTLVLSTGLAARQSHGVN